MDLSNNTIERICKIFGHLDALEKKGVDFVSSRELAEEIGSTEHTIRKDISLLGGPGYTRKGYEVRTFKKELGAKFLLTQKRNACIVGLGRLGTALLDYENFQEDGFEIVAGFDCNVNKIERIRTNIDVFPVGRLAEIVRARSIELGIIAVPAEAAQGVVDQLTEAGVKGVLNFSPVKVNVPANIVHLDMDFTNALRFIAARFIMKKNNDQK
ncbi:MAG: redox-sensing transcriptional repressor Rex [Candidatus Omnitrophica bacterium]|nr:redox-sensing transcriptional repressor Rex [Candidatus Omnitrophota bacterium]